MSTNAKSQERFSAAVIPTILLQDVLEWIRVNLEPEDVFTETELRLWSHAHGFRWDVKP